MMHNIFLKPTMMLSLLAVGNCVCDAFQSQHPMLSRSTPRMYRGQQFAADPRVREKLMMSIDPTDMWIATTSFVEPLSTATSTTVLLAATEGWVEPLALFLDPFINFMSFAMLARVVLSWYPEIKRKDAPWTLAVVFPTEPFLRIAKGVIPPAFGVDITPVFWLGIFTFIHEILLGQQGLLTMKIKYGI